MVYVEDSPAGWERLMLLASGESTTLDADQGWRSRPLARRSALPSSPTHEVAQSAARALAAVLLGSVWGPGVRFASARSRIEEDLADALAAHPEAGADGL